VALDAVASEIMGFPHKDILTTPAENISKIAISEKDCKRCGICLELCRNGAVKLKTSFLGRQLLKSMKYNQA